MKNYLIAALVGIAVAACMLVTFLIGRESGYALGYASALNEAHKADTVWVRDTITVDRPVEKWHTIEKPIYFPVTDTMLVSIHDTTYIALERTRKGYSGDDYEAVVSGVDPVLESISVFPKTAYITNTVVERRRWGFGVTAGPGVLYDGKIRGGVGIVAGLQYNF